MPPAPATAGGGPEPARKLGGETLTVLGFAFGLASLVQGYDSEQKLQTVVIALGVTVIGFAGYYLVARAMRPTARGAGG